MIYYTYMLQCLDGTVYTGIARDINRRMQEHFEEKPSAARYTRTHHGGKLLALWQSSSRKDAAKLEYHIKQLTREKKLLLIAENDFSLLKEKVSVELYTRVKSPELLGKWNKL